MPRSRWILRLGAVALTVAAATAQDRVAAAEAVTDGGAAGLVGAAVDAICGAPNADLETVEMRIRDAVAVARDAGISGPDRSGREELRLDLEGGGGLVVARRLVRGQARRFTVTFEEPTADSEPRPRLQVTASADCTNVDARRLVYSDAGNRARLDLMDRDLRTVRSSEPLNPPIPSGTDPGGVMVALIDSGINYTIPDFADRLARDAAGNILGYDYWDDDARPYDIDDRGGPFFPLHHGTAVAGVLIREAPDVRLLPFRYPRPRMDRMADLIAAADRAGAIIVTVPMSSTDADEWSAFVDAAAARPHMLFIMAAGNEGRDLDRFPRYPMAAGLDNALVVASATPFGKLAPGSNWGVNGVDFMVPAEQIETVDHRGATRKASGSSFAVPRVAALAARLLAANPSWRAPKLKAAIEARAHRSPYQQPPVTRLGWIANPADDG